MARPNETDVAQHQIQRFHTLDEMMGNDERAMAGSPEYRRLLLKIANHYKVETDRVLYILVEMAAGDLDIIADSEFEID